MSIESPATDNLDCDLCIVGAGYAALNGLNAAAKYLKKGERVVVIDKNATWGGQWLGQYDFVRMHQPYRMFTAGDQPWVLKREPSHLATRREVLDHLATVPRISAGHLDIKPLFGHAYSRHAVREGRVEVLAVPVENGCAATTAVRIRARRLLKATGTDIELLSPFALASTRVRSVGVSDPVITTREFLESSDPVYIIGSGKTAMDCVRQLAQSRGARRRSVNVIAGSGMWFFVRDNLYPTGRQRHFRGVLTGDLFLHLSQLFDGQNERDVLDWSRRKGYAHSVWDEAGNCRYGLLSLAERDEIRAGVDQVYRGHLLDVDGTRMTLRDGKELREYTVPEGAWFINCTSHLRTVPHEPVIQDSGLVCAPQTAVGFSGTSAYYVTHLWFREQLSAVAPELFRIRLDVQPKLRFAPQLGLMVMANMTLVNARLPLKIASKFEGDFNKWYPFHRQVPMIARIMGSQGAILKKASRILKLRFSDSPDVA